MPLLQLCRLKHERHIQKRTVGGWSAQHTCMLTVEARQRAVRPDAPWCSHDQAFMPSSTSSPWWIARSGPCTLSAGISEGTASAASCCVHHLLPPQQLVLKCQPREMTLQQTACCSPRPHSAGGHQ